MNKSFEQKWLDLMAENPQLEDDPANEPNWTQYYEDAKDYKQDNNYYLESDNNTKEK
jgi:hypothetical protein